MLPKLLLCYQSDFPIPKNTRNKNKILHSPHQKQMRRNRWNWNQSQRAPAFFKMGTNSPEMWVAITLSSPPNSCPPMNTAGNCGRPSFASSPAITLDNSSTTAASSSSSTSNTVGFTPRPNSSRITTWHMQHPRLPNTITAFSDTIFVTQVTSFIPTPGFMGPSLGSIVALDSPAELPPPVVGTHVRYGSAWCMATIRQQRENKKKERRERGKWPLGQRGGYIVGEIAKTPTSTAVTHSATSQLLWVTYMHSPIGRRIPSSYVLPNMTSSSFDIPGHALLPRTSYPLSPSFLHCQIHRVRFKPIFAYSVYYKFINILHQSQLNHISTKIYILYLDSI